MSLTKKYTFHDTFVKTCEFKNGQGDCKKTRESKKCIDDLCEIVRVPMKKKEILNDYYQNYNTQQGGSPENTFKCPYCDLVLPVKDLTTHIKSHTNLDSSKIFQQKFGKVKPTNKELFPQYGGCDTCMVGGKSNNFMKGAGSISACNMKGAGIHENKYICPLCRELLIISNMKDHFINFHQ
jgi:hypothetical protein